MPSSLRVLTKLKQISAQASETATEDQAADHTHQNKIQRTAFELNITEEPPTGDQLRTILEYIGESKAPQIVEGAKNTEDAIRRLKEDAKRFKPPVVCLYGTLHDILGLTSYKTVDWNNGRASRWSLPQPITYSDNVSVIGDNESEIMKMIAQLPKETASV